MTRNRYKKKVHPGNKDHWRTPDELFDTLDTIYDFNLDVAASHGNNKCTTYFTEEISALKQEWGMNPSYKVNAFCNPPFSLKKEFIIKTIEQVDKHPLLKVVMILPTGFNTQLWHRYILPRIVKGTARLLVPSKRINYLNDSGEVVTGCNFETVIVEFSHVKFLPWEPIVLLPL